MKFLYFWGPPIALMSLIFFLSGRQDISVADEYIVNFLIFKTLHVMEYALLFVLNYRAIRGTGRQQTPVRAAQSAYVLTLLYAASDELHQTFVPTREGALRDVIIDGFGAGIAWIILLKLLPKAPTKLRNLAKSLHLV